MTNCNSPVLVTKCAQLSISSASFGSAYNLNSEKSIISGQQEYNCALNAYKFFLFPRKCHIYNVVSIKYRISNFWVMLLKKYSTYH